MKKINILGHTRQFTYDYQCTIIQGTKIYLCACIQIPVHKSTDSFHNTPF